MGKCFQICVMTAEGTVLEGQSEYCSLPTTWGSVGILANHAPMLCALSEGRAVFQMEDGEEKTVSLHGGVANVRDNSVTILSDHAEIL